MRIHCKTRPERGTTLVDIVMATFILGILAAGIIGAFSYGFFIMQMVRENQRATQIVLEKVETIRLYSWDQVNTAGFIPATFTEVFDPQAAAGARGATYSGTVTLTNVPFNNSYSTNMRQLIVTLQWNNGSITRNRTLATLISKDGLQNYVY